MAMMPPVPQKLVPHVPADITSEFLSEIIKLSYDLDDLHVVKFSVRTHAVCMHFNVVVLCAKVCDHNIAEDLCNFISQGFSPFNCTSRVRAVSNVLRQLTCR